ncbi:MAG: hypothetical protein Q8K36_01355 [Alphaproteobacteria bacterium]|nr:hypothetical protein [Alphaproteobacteria bacterium]
MADYGVLSALRTLLIEDEKIIKHGLKDKIHLAYPPDALPPAVLLEIEEIWTSLRLGADCGHARIKIKTSVISNNPSTNKSLNAADDIKKIMDGKTIIVENGMRATIRLSNSVIDLPRKNTPRLVEDYYEILVRG